MVTLAQVKATNARAATTFPPRMVAVFAGATAGIGSTALLAFAKYTAQPVIYFIGRSEEQGAKLSARMKEVNPQGDYIFLQKDLSLLTNVDEVCKEIAAKEKSVNVLCMSQGTVKLGQTSEGLPYITAVTLYGRIRMANNLLPLIKRASPLRRIISIFTGTCEGPIWIDDIGGSKKVPLRLEALARKAPEVSVIHNFPGAVDTDLIRPESGLFMLPLKYIFKFTLRNKFITYDECGERHMFLCVSGMYPAKSRLGDEGIGLEDGLSVARGVDGEMASGVYSIDGLGESGNDKVVEVLKKHRDDGYVDKIWEHLEGEFKRVTGEVAVDLDRT